MKLIMNADDFGLCEAVNNAIADCFETGIVGSTTVMMNQPGIEHAIQLYKQKRIPEVGLHFTVTSGKPLLSAEEVSTLVDDDGYFLNKSILMNKLDVCPEQVFNEISAQYDAAFDAGFLINHIDSHHFGGVFEPLKQAFIRFANESKLPVRRIDTIVSGQQGLDVDTPDVFDMDFYDEGASLDNLKTKLLHYKETMPDAVIEFMCHPATHADEALAALSGYTHKRVDEWKILTSPELKHWLEEQQIECIGFDDF